MGKFYSNQPNQNIIMQRKLEKICGLSDEQILREFEKAQKNTCPLPIKPPPADEFERICRRVEAERRKILTAPQRVKWKRVAAVGLLAAALTGSGCFVALGKKSYFYREREAGGSVVLNNDSNKRKFDTEEEAYQKIQETLGIRSLKFGYKPYEMIFKELIIEGGVAKLRFKINGMNAFLMESKYETNVSFSHKSDLKYEDEIVNKWLGKKIEIYSENLTDGVVRYETMFVVNGVYYRFTAPMEKNIFYKMLESIVEEK